MCRASEVLTNPYPEHVFKFSFRAKVWQQDEIKWEWTGNGCYSASSAHFIQFVGRTDLASSQQNVARCEVDLCKFLCTLPGNLITAETPQVCSIQRLCLTN